jgi:hypothetical protein
MHCKKELYTCNILFLLVLLYSLPSFADLKEINEANSAMKAGFALSDDKAARIEANRLNTGDLRVHIALLAYYSVSCKSLPDYRIRKRRAEHILWIIEHAPTSELFNIANAIYQIFASGDRLADREGFQQAALLWMKQSKAHPDDHAIQRNVVRFLELGDPATAATLLRASGNSQSLGSLYSLALLGVVARDYRTGDSAVVDETQRNAGFFRQILAELRESSDEKLVGGAGFWTSVEGGMLYADGKLDWDYTNISQEPLQRAIALDPTVVQWYAVVDQPLPKRGQRPVRILGTSAANLVSRRIENGHACVSSRSWGERPCRTNRSVS